MKPMMSIGFALFIVSNFEKNTSRKKTKKNIGKDHKNENR